ncbi:hypothetical protein F4779DRAFT_568870 [Xylariaceae sp. FL0662B]|nr:hypothetical protein F4779DRAFT_568870 [Xylariaceae sp. FL0662B]
MCLLTVAPREIIFFSWVTRPTGAEAIFSAIDQYRSYLQLRNPPSFPPPPSTRLFSSRAALISLVCSARYFRQ